MKKYLLAVCFGAASVFPSAHILAQPNLKWQKAIGTAGTDGGGVFYPYFLKSSDGNIVISGAASIYSEAEKSQPGRGFNDPWVIKMTPEGQKIWDRTIRDLGAVENGSVKATETADGGYIVCATSASDKGWEKSENARGGKDYWVIKLSSSGRIEWDRTFGGAQDETANSVIQTADGNYLVFGSSKSGVSGDKTAPNQNEYEDLWVVKFSPAGEILWDKVFGRPGYDSAVQCVQMADGNYLLAGITRPQGNYAPTDILAIKIASDGSEIWNKTYGGDGDENLQYVLQTHDNGLILAGSSYSHKSGDKSENSRGDQDGWMVKISSAGTKQWDKTIGGDKYDAIDYLEELSDGGYLLSMTTNSGAGGDKTEDPGPFDESRNYWLVRLAPDRTKLWDKTYRSWWNDDLGFGTETSAGNYVIAGASGLLDPDYSLDRKALAKGERDIWMLGLTDQPIPETLTAFSVGKENSAAQLNWQTTAGSYNKRFEVQHAKNTWGWNHIMTLKTQGNGAHDYAFTHTLPAAGENRYRLKMVDIYDNITYSEIQTVTFDSTEINFPKLPTVQWDKAYGNTTQRDGVSDFGSLIKTSDGNYVMAGQSSARIDRDHFDMRVMKINPDGQTIWEKLFITTRYSVASSIIETADGGLIAAGTAWGQIGGDKSESSRGSDDFWIVKMAADGTKQWDKTFGGSNTDNAYVIVQTSDGGYIIGGSTLSPKSGDKSEDSKGDRDEYWIVKISALGEKEWDRTFGTEAMDYCTAIQQTADGGYLIGGFTAPTTGGKQTVRGGSDIWVIKLSPAGAQEWEKVFGGSGDDVLSSILPDVDGHFILAGSSSSPEGQGKSKDSNGARDFWLIKIDDAGNQLWDKVIGGADSDNLSCITRTSNGEYLIGGTTSSYSGFDKTEDLRYHDDSDRVGDFWLVKFTSDWEKVFDKTIGGDGGDYLDSVVQTDDNGYLLLGQSSSGLLSEPGDRTVPRNGLADPWLVKIAPDSPLPVTLATFTAQRESATTLLTWQTTSETRSDHFEIQHSLDGKTWGSIANVHALGENDGLHDYQFVHQNPADGNNYYRLKMVDTDASFTYSKVEQVNFRLDFEVNVYPNPATEMIHLQAPDWTKVKRIEILNGQGKVVYRSGKKPVQHLRAETLAAGLYFVKIFGTNGSETVRKIVVSR